MRFLVAFALLVSCAALGLADSPTELPVESVIGIPPTVLAKTELLKGPEQLETNLERPFIDEIPPEVVQESDCQPHVCHRMYRPICGLIDGVQITAPSRCEFNNKARCAVRARGDSPGRWQCCSKATGKQYSNASIWAQ